MLYNIDMTPGQLEETLKRAQEFMRDFTRDLGRACEISPAVLIITSGFELDDSCWQRFRSFYSLVRPSASEMTDAADAAAFMTISTIDTETITSRYGAARDYLNRFSGASMAVPAAMLSIVSSEIEETFDNLRLVCSTVSQNKLSLGGMENLSLGVKLLLGAASLMLQIGRKPREGVRYLMPEVKIASPALGIAAMAAVAVALTAFTTFHELTLHRLAVSDYAFHPAHAHFVYG